MRQEAMKLVRMHGHGLRQALDLVDRLAREEEMENESRSAEPRREGNPTPG